MPDSLAWLDASAQAELVARREVSPLELVEAAIGRIERLNGQLNAIVIPLFEQARERARQPLGGPFAGVPFVLKNLGATGAGEPQTLGMKALAEADLRSPRDTFLAARFRAAGLITVGKGNTPELGVKAVTEPELYGPTHNPWRLGHSPGGSSGGSAAAVAAGMVPLAHATDGGGSIRIPASCCGLVGLKPSRGRVSAGPTLGEGWAGLAYELAVTRSVRDTARLLDAVHGVMPGDPYGAPAPARPFADEVGADPGELTVGLLDRSPRAWPALHPDCATAAREAALLLESLGHRVELAHPPILDELDYRPAFLTVIAVHTRRTLDLLGEAIGRPLTREDMELWTWSLGEHGRTISAADYLAATGVFNTFSRELCTWWRDPDGRKRFDLLLSPTLLVPPPPHGYLATPPDDPLAVFDALHGYLPFTPIANVTGQPAISLPLHWNAGGLPVGIHLIGEYGREDLLLRVAAQLEQAAPWAERRPPMPRQR